MLCQIDHLFRLRAFWFTRIACFAAAGGRRKSRWYRRAASPPVPPAFPSLRDSQKALCLDSGEFLRVDHDANGLNPLCLHFNGQHEIGSITGAKDQCQLTIHTRLLHPREYSLAGSATRGAHINSSSSYSNQTGSFNCAPSMATK